MVLLYLLTCTSCSSQPERSGWFIVCLHNSLRQNAQFYSKVKLLFCSNPDWKLYLFKLGKSTLLASQFPHDTKVHETQEWDITFVLGNNRKTSVNRLDQYNDKSKEMVFLCRKDGVFFIRKKLIQNVLDNQIWYCSTLVLLFPGSKRMGEIVEWVPDRQTNLQASHNFFLSVIVFFYCFAEAT
jgi:hypothetical protein